MLPPKHRFGGAFLRVSFACENFLEPERDEEEREKFAQQRWAEHIGECGAGPSAEQAHCRAGDDGPPDDQSLARVQDYGEQGARKEKNKIDALRLDLRHRGEHGQVDQQHPAAAEPQRAGRAR